MEPAVGALPPARHHRQRGSVYSARLRGAPGVSEARQRAGGSVLRVRIRRAAGSWGLRSGAARAATLNRDGLRARPMWPRTSSDRESASWQVFCSRHWRPAATSANSCPIVAWSNRARRAAGALVLVYCWIAWLFSPLFPAFSQSELHRKLAVFAHSRVVEPLLLVSAAASWVAKGLLLAAAGARIPCMWLALTLLAIPAQFFVIEKQPLPSLLLGAVAGVLSRGSFCSQCAAGTILPRKGKPEFFSPGSRCAAFRHFTLRRNRRSSTGSRLGRRSKGTGNRRLAC
jgi:hypothetical protein